MAWRLSGISNRLLFLTSVLMLMLLAAGPLKAETRPQDSVSISLATYPFGDAASIHQAFSPLAQYLETRLGVRVNLIVTRDYAELARRLDEGTVDLAWIGSANYVSTFDSERRPQYIATYRERSKESGEVHAFYRAVILALASSGYSGLADLQGKRFGFTDPDSTSGHVYPRMMLEQQQIDPERFFSDTYFLGTHRSVIEALLAGSIQAGAVSDGTYYTAMAEHPGELQVLAWSDPIPLDAIVAAFDLSSETVDQVRQALLDIGTGDHPVNLAIQQNLAWPAAGFEQRSAEFYLPLKRALAGPSLEP
ncbi:phosphate/phosphite/phosphonate ABC transporter substrate-binding protein [Marinobacterium lutimaris]|uniref:Phosphonate transport system substrate-binding protein n=1 Tax=Marinobacterium lutimaris TaxID=568106 RepID=A0A1H6DLB6_9GAMM|nr:phosphate/phosphite/phosphonate ABC transporter substrate-binding protein [Marinobacterium lutimaris]SEG86227.1 phosphonate transport system substrate-binding protein [Marinobacterium lutimaris]